MTDTDRKPSLDQFARQEHERQDIPDGAFIYRTGDKTFVGYLEDFTVEGQFRPRVTGLFTPDSDENYLYEFRRPQGLHPDFDLEWTV